MTRLRQAASPGAGAMIYILPVVHRPSFHDEAWREQFDRELAARNDMARQAPPRTRPLVINQRPEK